MVSPKPAHQCEQLVLVADVEVVDGLVEQQHRRPLSERPVDHRPLAFTAGQLGEAAVGEGGQAGGGEDLGDDAPVVGAVGGDHPLVGEPAEADQLLDGEVEVGGLVLGDGADPAGRVPPREVPEPVLVEPGDTVLGCEGPVEEA